MFDSADLSVKILPTQRQEALALANTKNLSVDLLLELGYTEAK